MNGKSLINFISFAYHNGKISISTIAFQPSSTFSAFLFKTLFFSFVQCKNKKKDKGNFVISSMMTWKWNESSESFAGKICNFIEASGNNWMKNKLIMLSVIMWKVKQFFYFFFCSSFLSDKHSHKNVIFLWIFMRYNFVKFNWMKTILWPGKTD